jgi:TRAP-type C4-dicarboxylate transport system permease small subunit
MSGDFGLGGYDLDLPRTWKRIDRWVIRVTILLACVVGIAFTALITFEVGSRYLFNFSIFMVNSAVTFLLVWFFLLGAGLALRQRAHVGFEVAVDRMPPALARAAFVIAQLLSFVFFAALVWGGYRALGPSLRQVDGALGISYFWVMLAIPLGFLLLIYNQAAMFVSALRKAPGKELRP